MVTRAAFIFAGAVLLTVAIATLFLRNSEPSYKGRTLDQWVKASSQAPDQPDSREAIAAISTNYTPTLVRWLCSEATPRWTLQHKLPVFMLRNKFFRHFLARDKNIYRAGLATRAFEIAGTNATPAVSALAELVSDRHPLNVRLHGLYVLSLIGPGALPPLRQGMTNQYPIIRVAAVGCIKRLGITAAAAAPDLIAALSDPDLYMRQNATQALQVIAPNALTNLPAK